MGEETIFLRGVPASPGRFKGKVKIVAAEEVPTEKSKRESWRLSLKNCVAVTTELDVTGRLSAWIFDYAGAIVSAFGGVTSHAAQIARERRIPCVIVGVSQFEKLRTLEDGTEVIVDGTKGLVLKTI